MFELHWDDERIEHIAKHGMTIGEVFPVMPLQLKVELGALFGLQNTGDNAFHGHRRIDHEKSNTGNV